MPRGNRQWPPASHHAGRFLFGRYPAVGRELIDEARELMPQRLEQLVLSHAGPLAQRLERIAPERIGQVVGRNLLVGTGANPGLRGMTMPAVPEIP